MTSSKTTQPPPPVDEGDNGDGDDEGEPVFLCLHDIRETQPLERTETDGKMDYGTMLMVGHAEGLNVIFMPGTKESEDPFPLFLVPAQVEHMVDVLTTWLETGEWPQRHDKFVESEDLPKFPLDAKICEDFEDEDEA